MAAITASLADLSRRYRDTPMAGRSNLQQAVPLTFGFKMAALLAAMQRHRERLAQLRPRVLVGEFAGAVGPPPSLRARGLPAPAASGGRRSGGRTSASASGRPPGPPCATASARSAASSGFSPARLARSRWT